MEADSTHHQMERRLQLLRKEIDQLHTQSSKGTFAKEKVLTEAFKELSSTLEELKLAEEKLRQQNEELIKAREAASMEHQRYFDLFEYAPDGYIVTDAKGIVIEANLAAAVLVGISQDDMIGRPVDSFVARQDRMAFLKQLRRLEQMESLHDWEVRFLSCKGDIIDASISIATVHPPPLGHQSALRWLIRNISRRKQAEEALRTAHDELELRVRERTSELATANEILRIEIAERQRAEEALKENEERYRMLVESALDIVCTILVDGTISSLNPAFEMVTGWSPREWIGRHFDPIIHPDDLPFVTEWLQRSLKGSTNPINPTAEIRILSKWGEYLTLEFKAVPQVRNNEVVGLLGTARDITERKRAEEKIIQQNEFMNHVLESLTHPFCVLDANDYTIRMANSAASVGKSLAGMTCHALSHEVNKPCTGPHVPCPLEIIKRTKKPTTVEHTHSDANGNMRDFEVHAYPIFDQNGDVTQIIEYSFDITERKKMEAALRENAEKIKLFAYSVSHDLKGPAMAIYGLTKLLNERYRTGLDEKGQEYCTQIMKASRHVATLVEQINLYVATKEMPLAIEEVDMTEVLRTVKEEYGPQLSARRVEWREPVALPKIRADRVSLQRVFGNLVDNALKYAGKRLSVITIDYEESERHHIFSVTDNGAGVKREDLERIFWLFQRTRTSKGIEGSGLGLAIIREIAERHGGRAWIDPGQARGARFYIAISKSL